MMVNPRKKPKFLRQGANYLKKVANKWRRPRGLHSKLKLKQKSKGVIPNVGYGAPKSTRGLHPSGYEEVRIITQEDLSNLNKNKHAIKISSKLGAKKRIALIEYCQKRGFKILNLGISQQEIESLEEMAKTQIDDIELDELEDSLDMED